MHPTAPAAGLLSQMRRPRLLIRAARFGLADYDRRRSLRRIFPDTSPTDGTDPLPPLIECEAACEVLRTSGNAGYSVARHVEILIALISEAHRSQTAA